MFFIQNLCDLPSIKQDVRIITDDQVKQYMNRVKNVNLYQNLLDFVDLPNYKFLFPSKSDENSKLLNQEKMLKSTLFPNKKKSRLKETYYYLKDFT